MAEIKKQAVNTQTWGTWPSSEVSFPLHPAQNPIKPLAFLC